jgi:hypothetical protein
VRSHHIEIILWLATIGALLAATRPLRSKPSRKEQGQTMAVKPAAARFGDDDGRRAAIMRAAEAAIDGDLFRPDRDGTDSPPPAAPLVNATVPPPAAPKPRLVLRGIIGGPPWDAVLEGIPGSQRSVVVRTGDSIAGLKIRLIRRDTVTVHGLDTTWTLTIARPW